ncbi:MAG: histidine kinase [Bacteroidetes bacterium]|nr:histidine kinase [Bacteroidota bacterium]
MFANQPSYVNYTTADGLPSNTVFCSMQDSKGYMWFGTDKGVARFDGIKFTVFTTSDGLADNIAYDIYEDSKKRIWFSCNNGNACYYFNNKFWNKNTDTILRKLTSNSLGLKVIEDKSKQVYFLSQFNLFKLSKQHEVSQIVFKENPMFSSMVLNESGESIVLSNNGYCNLSKGVIHKFNSDKINVPLLYSKAIYFNRALYYNQNAFISFFNPVVPKAVIHTIPITNDPLIAQCLFYSKDSNMMVGTQNALVTYSLKQSKIIDKSFLGSSISSITKDIENNIWITSLNSGVFLSINSRVKLLNEHAELIFNYAGFIDKLSDGNIAIGSNKYLASFIENGVIHNLRLPKEAGEGKIEKIRIGYDGNYYLTTGAVTIKVDKSNWTAKVLQMSARDIRVISPTKSIIVVGNGVLVLNEDNFENLYLTKRYIKDTRTGHLIPNVKASGIYASPYSRNIYIYGLFGVKLLKGIGLKSIMNNHEYLANNINRVVETKDGLKCFASNIYGVIVIFKNRIFTINKKNGLPTNFVNSIYVDKYNQLWAATSEGLSKISIALGVDDLKFTIKNYTQSDGLNSKSFNDLTMDGDNIYATTDQGVCVFTEADLKLASTKPIVNIEAIYMGEKAQNMCAEYIVDYPNNSLSIKYMGLSFSSFGKMTYKYRMKGIENNWKFSQNTILEYPSMPYGEFDFELIAINANKVESDVKSFHIIVHPPFWRTWWFILLVLFCASMLILTALKLRIKSIRKNHETKEQLLNLKNKNIEAEKKQAIYEKEIIDIQNQALRLHMNPHFIFNSINSIQGFYASGDVAMAKKYIGKFSTLLRLILDQSKKDLIDINDEKMTIEYYLDLNKLRFENKFDYEIQIDESLLKSREEIPPMLIQPFIENAIIHGLAPLKRKGKIIVRIINEERYIRCEVEDNGVGRAYSRQLNRNKTFESTGIKVTEKRIELYNNTSSNSSNQSLSISDIMDAEGNVAGTLVTFYLLKNSI